MAEATLKRRDLIYPELSYKIVGILYETFNSLGYGYKETYYQRAIAANLKSNKLFFKEQVLAMVKFKGNVIGKFYLDFLIKDKIILEIKKIDRFSKQEIN